MAAVPDFDTYLVTSTVVDATVVANGVRLTWTDGEVTEHHRLVLRENSPDEATTHPLSREQQLQLTDLPPDLQIVDAAPSDDGGVQVTWSTHADAGTAGLLATSTFHPGWLRTWTTADHVTAGLPTRVEWRSDLPIDTIRFDGTDALAGGPAWAGWLSAIHSHGVGIASGLPADEDQITDLPGRIGPVRTTNFGHVFDVQTKTADVTSNAYTDLELPVHTDLNTREYMPGLQFLFCMVNDAGGGESRLSDAAAIARHLRDHEPEIFDALTTIPVTFINKATDTDYRHVAPFLVVDDDGELIEARWSPWLRGPLGASIDDAERWYVAARRALELGDHPDFVVEVKLQAGELLGFDNRRVLHGRGGLDRSHGERWLRGCYVEREELLSRLRILARAERTAAADTAG